MPTYPLPEDGTVTRRSTIVNVALVTQVERLTDHIVSETEQKLELMHEAYWEGREVEVHNWIRSLKDNTSAWLSLSNAIKATVLILEARIELVSNADILKAKQLADEAKEIAPSIDQVILRSLITYREEGPEKAIKLLEGRKDVDSLNFKASLLMDLGRLEDSLKTLSSIETEEE